MKIHIVTAEHFRDAGLIQRAFAVERDAIKEAWALVNQMLSDSGIEKDANPSTHWRDELDRLQDYHGAAHCYVEITEIEVAGSAFIDAALEIASQIAKAGTDDEGDVIVYADDVSGDVDILRDAQSIEGAVDAYLARFPADHRATAERAYQDGYADGVESEAPDALRLMRSRLAEAVDAWPQYDVDDTLLAPGCIPDDEISSEVNGGDLVEWFGEWRGRVKELLTTTA